MPVHALDLNQASKAQLRSIKGIGDKTAERILSVRKQGKFLSLDDFASRVPGFGKKRLRKLREQGVSAGTSPDLAFSHTSTDSGAALGRMAQSPANSWTILAPSAKTPGEGVAVSGASYRSGEHTGKAMPAMPMLIRPRPREKTESGTTDRLGSGTGSTKPISHAGYKPRLAGDE